MDVSENGVYTQIDQIALIHGEYDYQPLENWGPLLSDKPTSPFKRWLNYVKHVFLVVSNG